MLTVEPERLLRHSIPAKIASNSAKITIKQLVAVIEANMNEIRKTVLDGDADVLSCGYIDK